MRIAYLSADFGIPVYGNKGASIHVRELSAALRAVGHDVRIATCRLGGEPPAGFDVPVREIRLGSTRKTIVAAMKRDPAISEPMVKEIRSMLYGATLAQELLPELQAWQPNALYERYSLMSTAGVELARHLGIPLILEVNAPLAAEAEAHRGIGFRHTVHEVERGILQSADHVVAVSEHLRGWLIESGVEPERITVTPNRVNIARFTTAEAPASSRPTVGFVGTLKAWHGTETLVRALGEIARDRGPDAAPALLIVGDGPQRASLEEIAREEGIDGLVTFTCMVAHEEMPSHIGAMNIAVAPYNPRPDFYFSPLKLFEYMAAGRAIVAADIGQIAEIIDHGRTGLLVPPGDAAALAGAITRLIDDPDLATTLGRNAREDAVARFSWERNAETVTGLIDRARQPALVEGHR
jgi:glycosyltransferase involved in cell wall biosynthesis